MSPENNETASFSSTLFSDAFVQSVKMIHKDSLI